MSATFVGDVRPATKAGIAVLRFLETRSRWRGLLLLVFPSSAPELVYQAWVVAMRRVFGAEQSDQRAVDYLRGVTGSIGDAKVLVSLALQGGRGNSVARQARRGILPTLSKLVDEHFSSGKEFGLLVVAAEKRLHRLDRKTGHARKGRRMMSPSSSEEPTSVIGQTLKAQAMYDRGALRVLPEEPSDDAIQTVLNRVLAAALAKRFPEHGSRRLITSFSNRAASTARGVAVDEAAIAAAVNGILDGGLDDPELAWDVLLGAKVAAYVQAVEDLALYESEISDLIRTAEGTAEANGVRLLPMRR